MCRGPKHEAPRFELQPSYLNVIVMRPIGGHQLVEMALQHSLSGSRMCLVRIHTIADARWMASPAKLTHLLKDVVGRWRENIMVTKVKSIQWDNALADEIDTAFSELSHHVEGHSHTDDFQPGIPDLGTLKDMIRRVDGIIQRAKPHRS